jgi:hypothetical protein
MIKFGHPAMTLFLSQPATGVGHFSSLTVAEKRRRTPKNFIYFDYDKSVYFGFCQRPSAD